MKKSITNIITILTFIAGALICIGLRIYAHIGLIDHVTGFYYPEASFSGAMFYVITAAYAVCFLARAITEKLRKLPPYVRKYSQFTKRQCWVMGIFFLISGASMFYEIFNIIGKGNSLAAAGYAVASAAYLFIGFQLLGSGQVKKSSGYTMLIISVYFTISAASLFMNNLVIIRVSEYLILLLSYVAAALFFLALGRFFSDNDSKNSRVKIIFFGFTSSLLMLTATVPRFAVIFFGPAEISGAIETPPVSALVNAFLIPAVLLCMYGKPASDIGSLSSDE